ncbi:ABC transporter substrate-binding protein [Uliginosibacterium sp. H1]|uniref:ABC transporter substrate-binding protein n=1 Tax=Uliginosibacterium sp. H1 TaxID=3114757 RepID=UPI002E176B49|nr:ABC transporter substrate-binding protein [Uliginosibacterium sp. H1]
MLPPARPLFLSLVLLLAGCAPDEPVRVGFVGGLTGRGADLGESARNGVLLAVEQKNAGGGIKGRRIEVLVRDDAGQPDRAAQAVRELAAAGVDAIIGSQTSATTAAMVPELDASHVLGISPTASSMSLFGKDDYLVRINRNTRDNARDYAEYIRVKRGLRRVALVYDVPNKLFSLSWAEEFKKAMDVAGGEVVLTLPFDPNNDDSHAVAAGELLAARPDCVLMVTTTVDTARLAQQLRQRGSELPLLTSEWASTEQLIEMGGRAVDGMAMVQAHNRDDPSPAFRNFATAFETRFKREPGYAAVASYDATSVALVALERRQGKQSLKEAVLTYGPYQGLQQQIAFDSNGDTRRKVYFSVIRDGRFVLID